jgi:hypothetical protein
MKPSVSVMIFLERSSSTFFLSMRQFYSWTLVGKKNIMLLFCWICWSSS